MKALLIDNYDSFSYNLFHLWTSVTGHEPLIIRNDDEEWWNSLDPAGFGAILVSPGPGRPDRDDDFGISRAAMTLPAWATVPLLGVCLGHQGLGHAEGASVVPAPEPVHGRTSPITHNGSGIFAGLPSPFAAVRYHSLMVTDVPPTLEVIATTLGPGAAGIVMAMRHRTKPQWGVQFHPESIATEHGHRLMANFAALAAEHRAITGSGRQPVGVRSLPAVVAKVAAPKVIPKVVPKVILEVIPELEPTKNLRLITRHIRGESLCAIVFDRLFADQEHGYWLDSSAVIPGLSRFSIVGGGGPLSEWVTAHAGSGQVQIRPAIGAPRQAPGDVFSYLSQQLAARAIQAPESPFEFALGYVGFLGYELKAETGGGRAHESDLPDAGFLFSDRAVVVDHETHETWLLALTDDDHEPATENWLREAALAVTASTAGSDLPPQPVPAPAPPGELPIRYRHSPAEYAALVRECQTQIRDGESYEICLTNEITADVTADPLTTFLELRRLSPAPYAALLRAGAASVLSASPERFLKITTSGHIQAKPIKGTRRRGNDPVDDAQLARNLGESAKDRAENLMIVDLLRNDLGVVAVPGSVEVTRLFDVETFAAVHQLVSTVEAQLRPELDPIDCVRAAFPGGSMTGAPKRRTMQIIDRLEGGPRGIYSGALGYFSLNGAVDLSIVIRTLIVYPDRVTLGVGGAVIALSEAEAEVEEMLLKAQAPLEALFRSTTGRRP